MASKTHQQYEEELLEKEIDYFPLEQYAGKDTPILHECLNGHQWKVKPNNILSGRGCGSCRDYKKKTHAEYTKELLEKKISYSPIESYINTSTPILHKCLNGHEWKVKPNDILSGHGCPQCNRKGVYSEKFFEKNPEQGKKPGILYCVVLVNRKTMERVCIKIGITQGTSNRDVLKRAGGFKGYDVRIQKLVHGTLEEVYYLEEYLHELWADRKYKSEWKFGGHTELFELDDAIIRSIPTNV